MIKKVEFQFNSLGVNLNKLSEKEKIFFLSYLFTRIHGKLYEKFISDNVNYLGMNRLDSITEEVMLETHFLMYIIHDILSSEEYTLAGIAYYTQMPEDAIQDLFIGLNKNPSSIMWKKIIDLHSTIRKDFYRDLIKKIVFQLDVPVAAIGKE